MGHRTAHRSVCKRRGAKPDTPRKPSNMNSVKIMLCLALLIASAIVTVSADTGKFSSCCTRVSSARTKIPLEDFLIQKADLPCVEAVLFITQDGKILCSKPNLPWVIQKMKEIRAKKEALQNSEA